MAFHFVQRAEVPKIPVFTN